jgi:hypothetical protein
LDAAGDGKTTVRIDAAGRADGDPKDTISAGS